MTAQTPPLRPSALGARIEALKGRHAAVDAKVVAEQSRPAPCFVTLRGLKKKKLSLKQEIAEVEGLLRTLQRVPAND